MRGVRYEAFESMARKEMHKVCACMRLHHTANGGEPIETPQRRGEHGRCIDAVAVRIACLACVAAWRQCSSCGMPSVALMWLTRCEAMVRDRCPQNGHLSWAPV